MGMALTQMLWAVFITVANIPFIVSPGHLPWVSWASVGLCVFFVYVQDTKQTPIPLPPSSLAPHTGINTATETDGSAYSLRHALDIQGLLPVVFTF
ncbi:hypothetical protein K438DRAFT_1984500 [Mycena galopus ATCC 62051]|nr:hypothetical protein K438DRAFT_1984500 [Mycena galopus ATCC 62051]